MHNLELTQPDGRLLNHASGVSGWTDCFGAGAGAFLIGTVQQYISFTD